MNHLPQKYSHPTRASSTCRGFSLVELMIALLISLVLIGGTVQIFASYKQGYRIQNALGHLQENGRYSSDIVSRDIRRTGYLGGNPDVTTIGGTAGPTAVNTACVATDNTWGRMIGQPVFGLDDTNAGYACIPASEYTRGDVLVIRYASGSEATAFTTNRLYLRTAFMGGSTFKGTDEAANTVVDNPQSTRELVAHAFFVGPGTQQCPDGSVIPSLHWKSLGDDGFPASEELIVGADNFQVQYGVDINSDQSADQYLDADTITTNAAFNWGQVITVRFWLLIGSGCAETGFTNSNTYNMGDQAYTPNDAIRRQLYTTTVSLRN